MIHCMKVRARGQGMASLNPRGMIGRIYAGDHYTLLLTKYISCGTSWFLRRFFGDFPFISLWELYVVKATRVLSQSATANDVLHEI